MTPSREDYQKALRAVIAVDDGHRFARLLAEMRFDSYQMDAHERRVLMTLCRDHGSINVLKTVLQDLKARKASLDERTALAAMYCAEESKDVDFAFEIVSLLLSSHEVVDRELILASVESFLNVCIAKEEWERGASILESIPSEFFYHGSWGRLLIIFAQLKRDESILKVASATGEEFSFAMAPVLDHVNLASYVCSVVLNKNDLKHLHDPARLFKLYCLLGYKDKYSEISSLFNTIQGKSEKEKAYVFICIGMDWQMIRTHLKIDYETLYRALLVSLVIPFETIPRAKFVTGCTEVSFNLDNIDQFLKEQLSVSSKDSFIDATLPKLEHVFGQQEGFLKVAQLIRG